MTVVLCTYCGSTKIGARVPCNECGHDSTGNSDLDITFSNRYLAEDTLHGLGEIIKRLRKRSQDKGVVFWAFIAHIRHRYPAILRYYPRILISDTPREYDAAVRALLVQSHLPEIMVEDSPGLEAFVAAVAASKPIAQYMSRARHHQIECESCGHVYSFAVWSRINGTTDPWLNEKIYTGCLFRSNCRQCGAVQTVPCHTLYLHFSTWADKRVKIGNPFAIWLRMPGTRREFECVVPSQDYFNNLHPGCTLRAVNSSLELAEKIHVFRDGHDDILVEFVKGCVYVQQDIDPVYPMYYLRAKKSVIFGTTLTFCLLGPKGNQEVHYTISSQKNVVEQIMAKIRPALPDLSTEWHCVDRHLVMQTLLDSEIVVTVHRNTLIMEDSRGLE